jgi:RND family efflux transporter MFP subunit
VLEEASLRRERAQKLYADQLMARSDLDAAESAYLVADGRYQDARDEVLNRLAVLAQRKAELDLAGQQLRDTVLTAPFDGSVRERHVAVGQFVAVGQPVVTIVRTHPLRLRLAVPERDAAALRVGQSVALGIEGDPQQHAGRVVRLSPAIEENSRTLMVEAEVPNPDGALRPGSFAKATIVTAASEPVVLVPLTSIVTFAGMEKVLIVQEGRVVERRVRTGRRQAEVAEILEGIAPGDHVIVEPGSLVGGQAVTTTGI